MLDGIIVALIPVANDELLNTVVNGEIHEYFSNKLGIYTDISNKSM